jgi:YfiH family protein
MKLDPRPDVSFHPDWIVPDWPAPAKVRALCTTRAGGASMAPYDSLNLGDHVRDDPAAVATNRRALQQAIAARPVFLQQVHGIAVASLDVGTPDATIADAVVTSVPGVACTIMVADCLPVLLTNRLGTRVGAAHAGWRGLAGEGGRGVLEAVFESFWPFPSVDGSQSAIKKEVSSTLAWLGPCIGPQAFEVGPEVRDAFCGAEAQAARCFTALGDGKYLADLQALARQRLNALGVTSIYGNDGSPAWCTFGNRARYFSHRRDARALGGSGRLAACVWLAD